MLATEVLAAHAAWQLSFTRCLTWLSSLSFNEKASSKNFCFADVVFVCNAYHIGKERCYFKGTLACGFKVWASPSRVQTLRRLDLPSEWLALLTSDRSKCDVIISDRGVSPPQLRALHEELLRPVVGFQCTGAVHTLTAACNRQPCTPHVFRSCGSGELSRPKLFRRNCRCVRRPDIKLLGCVVGWSFQKSGVKKREQDNTLSYGIPYSEHSSWLDLRACVKAFRPKELVRCEQTCFFCCCRVFQM